MPNQPQTLLNLPYRAIVMCCHRAIVETGKGRRDIDVLAWFQQQARVAMNGLCRVLSRRRFEFANDLVQQTVPFCFLQGRDLIIYLVYIVVC